MDGGFSLENSNLKDFVKIFAIVQLEAASGRILQTLLTVFV